MPVTHILERTLLTLATALVVAVALWGMRRGWQNKVRTQADIPQPPHEPVGNLLLSAVPGRFVGTVRAGQWLDRIVAHGLGTPRTVDISVYENGVLIADSGGWRLWLERPKLCRGTGLAGDIAPKDSLLILNWRLGTMSLESGVRADAQADSLAIEQAIERWRS